MEGLFAVIFIIIGIVNFAQKQQQNQNKQQGGMRTQQSGREQRTPQQRRYTVQPTRKVNSVPIGNPMEVLGKLFEDVPQQSEPAFESEGLEEEDRRRTGSMDYVEDVRVIEGICDEHPEHAEKKTEIKKPEAAAALAENEETFIFDLTEKNLVNSLIMAEIIGPPRSMKRNIR